MLEKEAKRVFFFFILPLSDSGYTFIHIRCVLVCIINLLSGPVEPRRVSVFSVQEVVR